MTCEVFHAEALRILTEELADAAQDAAVHTEIASRSFHGRLTVEWRILVLSDLIPDDGALSIIRSGPEVLDEFRAELRFIARCLEREAVVA